MVLKSPLPNSGVVRKPIACSG